ncbi:anti-sigma factor RsbA family regulatory protein [Micromonospora sp. URMC 105]|uniref:anti-sigma factor RsbA family regulatory protein n=1 Tax=Micromonospora sp. URMC 105 TaxID=3423413 RepID=UPI003F19E163
MTGRGLRHDALLYAGDEDYLDAIRAFVAAGRAADEPVLVAVPAHRLTQVGAVLGASAGVTLADMSTMGRNPAAIIPTALREFVHRFPGRRLRIVGESLWPGRRPAAYRHCVEHEAMINLALGAYPLDALCLFDRSRLPADALADVGRTHPVVRLGPVTRPSAGYQHPEEVLAGCAQALPPPPADAAARRVEAADLAALRAAVAATAVAAGLPADRVDDLRIAVTELAANVITHGGGPATVRWWVAPDELSCEVSGDGVIADPFAGRLPAPTSAERGRGLLLVQQLCDLVDIRVVDGGSTVRVQMELPVPAVLPAPRSAPDAVERGLAPL